MALTRFYDRQSGRDGPVSGALQVLPIHLHCADTNAAHYWSWSPPAGMKFHIVSAYVIASTVTSDPSLTIGTAAAGTQIVAPVNVTTALGALTLKSNEVTAGDRLDVRVANDTTDTANNINVTIVGYVSASPNSEALRS